MKIKLISDTHFEGGIDTSLFNNTSNADILVLAGDINVGENAVWTTLKQFAEHHPQVCYVMGSHEAYHHNLEVFIHKISEWCKHTNIHFLNPGRVTFSKVNGKVVCNGLGSDKLTIIGGALWTNFANDFVSKRVVPRMINDFRVISTYAGRPFSADDCATLYDQHAGYIKDQYEAVEGKKVIVTHFLPDRICIDKQYQGPELINNYFANNLGSWISELEDVPYWLHGHTHSNVDLIIGTTRVIANPYGYNKNQYYKECLIEV